MDNENIYDAAYKEAHTIEYVETKNNFEEEPKKEMEMDLQSILQ